MSARLKITFAFALGAAATLIVAGCPVVTPPTATDPAEFTNASQVRGGLLYDKWWSTASVTAPTTDHPLWASRPDTASNSRTGSDTWRCKECHGWDYKGVDGAYSSGSHKTGIAGIFGTTKTAQETFDLIKTNHGFGDAGLSDADIWDLAKFVLEGQIDTDTMIDGNGMFTGDTAAGMTLYDSGIGTNTACAGCHGSDGLTGPPGSAADYDDWVGKIANANPWEFQHKVRFGQPNTAMPSSVTGGGSDQNVNDLGAYSQSLPTEVAMVGGDAVTGQTFYSDNNCATCHGADASGDIGPDLAGKAAGDILDKLDGTVSHGGGTFSGVTQQNADDLAAWLGG
ncbi:MAG: cytochrome c [Planctomycetes bacterium]|nr:cytochrome c [Planctomycetota bacterium]